ncbi:hypothetical protein H5410_020168 [Solanum commersonii]|uniref:Uncharacterized protein n=1 Tax=Solanum commersonii TaxID=4109 RepID=A0A9J5ZAE9_SOLCO|nr:hypothetical protein H5410_020168 [Solanum commersonii]
MGRSHDKQGKWRSRNKEFEIAKQGWIVLGGIFVARQQRKKSFHLVKWEAVMTSKENGGLGIKNLKLQSKDRIRRNFLWQGNKEKKSFHLVKWEEVMTSKENGGLGIKNLKLQSKALSMKWLWKYANNNQMLWREVIGAKYEKEDNWITKK